MDILIILGCLPLGILIICKFLLLWNEMWYGRRKGLPLGTMGWPIFGETLEFVKKGPLFMKQKRARYGDVFRTHILGSPTIISMDQEFNRYIFMNEAKGLVPGYPKSTLDVLGRHNIGALIGTSHKQIRALVMMLIGPSTLKDKLLPMVDRHMDLYLQDFHDGKVVDIQELSKDMVFSMSLKLIMEQVSCVGYEAFKSEFDRLVVGTISLPVNFPGTNYHQGLQGRKNVIKILKEILEKRRASSVIHDDMLNTLLMNDDSRYNLSDEEIIDQIIMILNSGYETVSTTTMMAIKYLHDHPKALQELRDEHFMILQNKTKEQPIDWNEYKMMKFTRAVILETMRLATVVNGVLRKTTQDIELKGFVIPRGWKIYMFTREINYDPYLYPDPFKFNPWRWLENGMETHDYCFLFGGGTRLCPGKEIGIATISLFLRYFVTRYRWEETGGGWKIHEFPRVEAPKGMHARLFKYF